jgi:hypothetical protein
MLQSRSSPLSQVTLTRATGADTATRLDLSPPRNRGQALSWAGTHVWDAVSALWQASGQQTLSVLNIAALQGDLAIALGRRAKRAGLPCRIEACDGDAQAVVAGRFAAADAGVAVEFFQHDAPEGMVPLGYDIIVCGVEPYELGRTLDEATGSLRHMHESCDRMVVVCTLERDHVGPSSLAEAARRAGMQHVRITRRFPGRIVLTSQRR